MAPCKPTATAKPARKRTTGKSDKVVKRPARGYHTYKNGLLNVTPKGGEKELVERNSKSPLLRLPAEIRNRIWEYTLGHSVYRARPGYVRRVRPSIVRLPAGSGTSLALLQSCRQIYSEAALMPLHLNTFVFESISGLKRATSPFTKIQRKHIRNIRFDLRSPQSWGQVCFNFPEKAKTAFADFFPSLRSVEVSVYCANDPRWQSTTSSEAEAQARARGSFALFSQDFSIDITVVGLDQSPLYPW